MIRRDRNHESGKGLVGRDIDVIRNIQTTIPFTLQTMGVFLAVNILGGTRGTLSVLVYILLGAIGIPVFSVIYTLIEDWIHRRLKEKKIYFPPADKEE